MHGAAWISCLIKRAGQVVCLRTDSREKELTCGFLKGAVGCAVVLVAGAGKCAGRRVSVFDVSVRASCGALPEVRGAVLE